jgi:hypothetical protein
MNKKIISSLLVIFSLVIGFTVQAETNVNTIDKSNTSTVVGAGQPCGGNIVNPPRCIDGYHCGPVAGQTLPVGDVGGICVIDSNQQDNVNNENNNNNQDNNQNNNNELDGQEHQSAVAAVVQSLLDVASKDKGGIGDQVKAIAKEQNDSKENVANEIDKVKNRNGFKTFLIGTDYKTIGELRSEMVITGNQIDQLKALLAKSTDVVINAGLQTQIDKLQLQKNKIEDFIKANESKFSLFGWFVKLFNQ